MTRREPPILTRLIRPAVRALAEAERVPAERVAAYCQAAESIFYAQVRALFGGEQLRLHAPTDRTEELRVKRGRICSALERGETVADIARRERVSARWVRKLRGTVRP